MYRYTTDGSTAANTPSSRRPSKSTLLTAALQWRRRVILRYLDENSAVTLSDLAEYVAKEQANAAGRGPTTADEKRSQIHLHHIDIPLFADLGLVTYDADSQTVTPTSAVDELDAIFFASD